MKLLQSALEGQNPRQLSPDRARELGRRLGLPYETVGGHGGRAGGRSVGPVGTAWAEQGGLQAAGACFLHSFSVPRCSAPSLRAKPGR